jgi:hypothetical protein
MKLHFAIALLAATALAPAANAQNAVGGAASGAIVGGVVGGPVGAAVGAAVGGTVGAASEDLPPPVVTYVERENVPSVEVREVEHVRVGTVLPETVVLHEIPKYKTYRYAVINHERVIVEPRTRKVIKVIKR